MIMYDHTSECINLDAVCKHFFMHKPKSRECLILTLPVCSCDGTVENSHTFFNTVTFQGIIKAL